MSVAVTKKQRDVLVATYHATGEWGGPATEYRIHRAGAARGLWGEGLLYGHLAKLTARGLLARSGVRGNYHYELTTAGRMVLT